MGQEREKVYLRAIFESAATSWILKHYSNKIINNIELKIQHLIYTNFKLIVLLLLGVMIIELYMAKRDNNWSGHK